MNASVLTWLLLSFISYVQLQELIGDSFLFDLTEDPRETTSLYTDDDYTVIKRELKNRIKDWYGYMVAADVPDMSKVHTIWKKEGGVVPWLDEEQDARTITQKYSYDKAPNIVIFLVDDWGYNDIGYRSTYLDFTTPNIDKLAAEGIKFDNYFSSYLCVPARAALLTGRYPLRYGMYDEEDGGELPLDECTIAEELKSAGYRTYMVGKWHVGYSSVSRTPTYRGFDYFYGFYNGFIDYWSKEYSGYLDLSEGTTLVTDADETDKSLHSAYLFEEKAENAIKDHFYNYNDQPFFMYYAAQLVHADWAAPQHFIDRCAFDGSDVDGSDTYCAMNLMLDEVIANLTCTLDKYVYSDNTILIVISDNGCVKDISGCSYPYRGNKGSTFRGGISASGFIHSKLIPESARGKTYEGNFHVTDWLPTVMGLATNNEWTESYVGNTIDGTDMWSYIIDFDDSPKSEIVHYLGPNFNYSIQYDNYKLDAGTRTNAYTYPDTVYTIDQTDESYLLCEVPSLVDDFTTDGPSLEGDDDIVIILRHTTTIAVFVVVFLAIVSAAIIHFSMRNYNNCFFLESVGNRNQRGDKKATNYAPVPSSDNFDIQYTKSRHTLPASPAGIRVSDYRSTSKRSNKQVLEVVASTVDASDNEYYDTIES
jgi:arylsulfatase B/arylsulfatase I/J